MRLLIAFCLLCAGTPNAADDPQLVLRNAGQKVADAVGRSDNYICMQDLSRFYYAVRDTAIACHQPPEVPAAPLLMHDRLKLDVAVSQGAEIYSWHGENKFSGGTVGELVRNGPIASGSFNGYLRNIFGERGVQFTYRGQSKANGLDLYHFDYDVPLELSHYQVQAGKANVLTPFHGSFSVNADNFELYSLTVTANGEALPKKTDICASETRLVYQLAKISNRDSLLPASFDLLIGGRDGTFTESKGIFTGCRAFTGESTLHFDVDDSAAAAQTPVTFNSEPLRAGVHLQIGLRGEIDEDSAYAGMPVEAVLLRNAKVSKGVTLARGATLRGTVTRFQVFHQPTHAVAIKLEFNDITDGKNLYLCSAVHETTPVFSQNLPMDRRGLMTPRATNRLPDPGDGGMLVTDTHMHLDKKFASSFVTVDRADSAGR